jgi:4-amino-4-deoxy-L-arabinose transferase-like glycosyltransferase
MNHPYTHPCILIVLCTLLYGAGIIVLPPTDRDEARFIQASKQMLETDNYMDIRFQGETRYKKPIGIYWLQVAAVKAMGQKIDTLWPYRLPSFLGALASVILVWYFFKQMSDEKTAFRAALLLMPCLIMVVEAHLAKTDAVLLLFIMISQGALGTIVVRSMHGIHPHKAMPLLFWLGLALGILIKGPLIVMVVGVTILMLKYVFKVPNIFKNLQYTLGVPLCLLIVLPWFLAIQHQTGGAFARESLGHDFIDKILQGQESHGAPPLYYLILSPVLLWPSFLYILPALRQWRLLKTTPAGQVVLSWLPVWLIFEGVPTKLPHYVLPVFPALAFMTALLWDKVPHRSWEIISKILFSIVILALMIASVFLPMYFHQDIPWGTVVVLLVGLILIGAGWGVALKNRQAIIILCGAICLYGAVFKSVLPALKPVWLSVTIQDTLYRLSLQDKPLAIAGYQEPSVIFLTNTTTVFTSRDGLKDFLARYPDGVAVLAIKNSKTAPLDQQPRATFQGFNYSNGETLVFYVYTNTP